MTDELAVSLLDDGTAAFLDDALVALLDFAALAADIVEAARTVLNAVWRNRGCLALLSGWYRRRSWPLRLLRIGSDSRVLRRAGRILRSAGTIPVLTLILARRLRQCLVNRLLRKLLSLLLQTLLIIRSRWRVLPRILPLLLLILTQFLTLLAPLRARNVVAALLLAQVLAVLALLLILIATLLLGLLRRCDRTLRLHSRRLWRRYLRPLLRRWCGWRGRPGRLRTRLRCRLLLLRSRLRRLAGLRGRVRLRVLLSQHKRLSRIERERGLLQQEGRNGGSGEEQRLDPHHRILGSRFLFSVGGRSTSTSQPAQRFHGA
ncbi:MAG: hypothetical protein ABW151_05750 [Pseudorhodoplanes sp.]